MKKTLTIIIAVMCLVAFIASDASAKQRKTTRSKTTTFQDDISCLSDINDVDSFFNKVQKNGKELIGSSDDDEIKSFCYEYSFLGKDNVIIDFMFEDDYIKLVFIKIPVNNYNEGQRLLSRINSTLSKKYKKVYQQNNKNRRTRASYLFSLGESSCLTSSLGENNSLFINEAYVVSIDILR